MFDHTEINISVGTTGTTLHEMIVKLGMPIKWGFISEKTFAIYKNFTITIINETSKVENIAIHTI